MSSPPTPLDRGAGYRACRFRRRFAGRPALSLALLVLALAAPPAPALAQGGVLQRAASLVTGESASSEEGQGEGGDEGREPQIELPGIGELVPSALALEAEAETAAERIRELEEFGDLPSTLDELEAEVEDLDRRLDEREAVPASLASRVVSLQDRLSRQGERLRSRLESLEDLRSTWSEKARLWRAWQEKFSGEERPDLAGVAATSLERIRGVVAAVDEAIRGVLEAQRSVEMLGRRLPELVRRTGLEAQMPRAEAGRVETPWLGSAAHREQLAEGLWPELAAGWEALTWPDDLFFEAHRTTLGIQLLVLLAVGFSTRSFRSWARRGEEWTGILEHPWLLGIFVAVAPSELLYQLPPPLWRMLVWTVFAVSGAILAGATFRSRAKRWVIYGLAVTFVLLQLFSAVGVPPPWFRVGLSLVCVLGIAFLSWAQHRARGREDRRTFRFLVWLALAVLALTLAAEIFGFDRFARHLLESSLASAFVVLAVALLLRLGHGAIRAGIRRLSSRFDVRARVGRPLTRALSRILAGLLGFFALVELGDIWGLFATPLDGLRTLWFFEIPLGFIQPQVGQILLALLTLYLAYVLSTILRGLFEAASVTGRDLEAGVRNAISTLIHYLLIAGGFMLALSMLGFDITSLALILGALGVGIGLGLQDLVANFFAGLVLLFERPVRVGDTVVIQGEWSTVKKIGLRSTLVTTFDRSEIIVPNRDLISEKVSNWSLSDQVSRIIVQVGVAYGSDVERVLGVLQEVAVEHPKVLEDPAPLVLFTGFGDSALTFELRSWVGSIEDRLPVRSDLHGRVARRFREEGITIPFPQRDLHLRSMADGVGEGLRGEDVGGGGGRGSPEPGEEGEAEERTGQRRSGEGDGSGKGGSGCAAEGPEPEQDDPGQGEEPEHDLPDPGRPREEGE